MGCLSQGRLRAYLDGALAGEQNQEVARHVAACPRCAARVAHLRRLADGTKRSLACLSPRYQPDERLALARLRARVQHPADSRSPGGFFLGRLTMLRTNARLWRPLGVGLLIVALVVGVFSFAPGRAFARQLLSVFRVRRFAVIRINTDPNQIEEAGRTLAERLLPSEPTIVADEPVVRAASLEEASALAGFPVRLPRYLPGEGELRFEVKGRTEAVVPISRDALVLLLEMAEMDASVLPANLDPAEVRAVAPAMVAITEGEGMLTILQVKEPTIIYPDGLDPQVLGEAGLRVLGIPPAEARRISRTIDWATTLILPIPANLAEVREVEVAGSQGVVLQPYSDPQYGSQTFLLWEKDGIVYLLSRPGSSAETLIQIAQSMF